MQLSQAQCIYLFFFFFFWWWFRSHSRALVVPLGFYYEHQLAFYYGPLDVLVTIKFRKQLVSVLFTFSHSLIHDRKTVCCNRHRLASAQALPSCSSFGWRGLSCPSLCGEVAEPKQSHPWSGGIAVSGASKSSFAIKYQKLFKISQAFITFLRRPF